MEAVRTKLAPQPWPSWLRMYVFRTGREALWRPLPPWPTGLRVTTGQRMGRHSRRRQRCCRHWHRGGARSALPEKWIRRFLHHSGFRMQVEFVKDVRGGYDVEKDLRRRAREDGGMQYRLPARQDGWRWRARAATPACGRHWARPISSSSSISSLRWSQESRIYIGTTGYETRPLRNPKLNHGIVCFLLSKPF
jgi:hypothetical protein